MCYDNYPDMREFVLSCKGRPFAMMSSQRIPVPTLSLIDFQLVQDLGLKMSEIQCSKLTFAGSKLRILGKINQTVQCVKNGKLEGNLHFKANVVEDLKSTFDTHSIAGNKMTKLLTDPAASCPDDNISSPRITSPSRPSTPPPAARKSSPSTPRTQPPDARTSARSTPRTPTSAAARTSKPSTPTSSTSARSAHSPPGFPTIPQYSPPRPEVSYSEPSAALSKPPLGYVRRLQLRPASDEYVSWHHGRVTRIPRPDCASVDVLRLEGDPLYEDNPVYSEYCRYPGLNVAVNDVVLFHGWDNDPELSWEESKPHIRVVYNTEEVDHLKSHGVKIPDCPPERLPGGYYG